MKTVAAVVVFLAGFLACALLQAQTVNIGGVINQYTAVLAIDSASCMTQITVADASAFESGDTVLVIQMKGAVVDTSNTASFGNIISYGTSGNYEFGIVGAVSANVVHVSGISPSLYNVWGKVQLIKVPVYQNANITTTLTAAPWNGVTGGVLVFIVNGTLEFNADVDLSEKGFRGGDVSNNNNGGCGAGSPDYYYELTQTGSWSEGGAMKGEGIAEISIAKMGGRGCLANGGGGGNKHNTGGGGGGNFTGGGKGGNEMQGCTQSGNGGVGGYGIPFASTKAFLGGGGGCGDYNNSVGTNGTDGGGIVMIKANDIVGNGYTIKSNGGAHVTTLNNIGDGEGGGGAGGTILMEVSSYSGTLTVQANGANGGNQNSTYGCFGPGGGGGSGVVAVNGSGFPPNVTVETNAGLAGLVVIVSASCYNTNYGATDGVSNPDGIIEYFSFDLNFSAGPFVVLDLGDDVDMCDGGSVSFDVTTPNATYLWQDGSTTSTFTASASGTYWVALTVVGCMAMSDTVVVTEHPFPVVNFGPDTILCPGSTLTLDASVVNATYLWQDGSTDADYMIDAAGSYNVTVTSEFGCSIIESLTADYEAPIVLELGPDTTLCSTQSYQLTASGSAVNFVWQNGSTASTISASNSGLYSVTAYSTIGCNVSDSANVTYVQQVSVSLGSDTALCDGEELLVNTNINDVTFLWHDGSTESTFTTTTSGEIWVEVTASPCPVVSDTLLVIYNPIPVVNLGSDTALCIGDTLHLDAYWPTATYAWQDGATTATYEATETDQYSVTVLANGCEGFGDVIAGFLTAPSADLGSDTTLCKGDNFILEVTSSFGEFLWQDGSTNSLMVVSDSGKYSLTVSTTCGFDADTIHVFQTDCYCKAFVPNTFTPNGDALNDLFRPFFECAVSDYHLMVFDRWGERVFDSASDGQQWNGTFKGQSSPLGVYVWMLWYSHPNAHNEIVNEIIKGNVTLLR